MNIATKQVDKLAISEELFHEVVEEHIPVLIKKQSALLTSFLENMRSYIVRHTQTSDWFYISNQDI